MSPASTSKSKGKSNIQRAAKEQSKVAVKPSHMPSDSGNGSTGSAYDAVLGTFFVLETSSSSAATEPQGNDRFRSIDDPDDHSGSSLGMPAEYDSVSNNGSCSGESEDHKKPTNAAPRMEVIPVCGNDKRDKIRQKNERKHQRQKERRAQELHERCTGFLESRKLEALSHQLVVMGFPADKATMAVIINEGRIEDSVAWLLHEGEEENNQQAGVDMVDRSHVKVDIADELIRLEQMEIMYKCTKQEVERAVIAFEGDLFKAAESLRVQMQTEVAAAAPKQSDESMASTGLSNKVAAPNQYTVLMRNPSNGAAAVSIRQQRREEKDFHYTKSMACGQLLQESANRILKQQFNGLQPKPTTEWSMPQIVATDKKWSMTTGTFPVSEPLVSPEARYGLLTMGHEIKAGLQAGAFKEPHIIQYLKQNMPSSIAGTGLPPPAFTSCYSSSMPSMEMMAATNSGLRPILPGIGTGGSTLQQFYPQSCFQYVPSGPTEFTDSSAWSSHSLNATGGASFLVTPSSLGLFARWGSTDSSGSKSQNEWNSNGVMRQQDYTSIDWSLNLMPKSSFEGDRLFDTWPTMAMGGNSMRRPLMNGSGGVYFPGFQENGGGILTGPSLSDGSHEWTNPFEGRDLLYGPRKYVTSPSL